jgi:hypothetical protein
VLKANTFLKHLTKDQKEKWILNGLSSFNRRYQSIELRYLRSKIIQYQLIKIIYHYSTECLESADVLNYSVDEKGDFEICDLCETQIYTAEKCTIFLGKNTVCAPVYVHSSV